MKAILMAGGEGKRLRPVSGDTPKPLVRLLGRPMIEHILFLLRHCGFSEAVVSLGYKADRIEERLKNGDFGIPVRFSREETPLGTAGGVRLAWERFAKGETVLVISGDAACDLDLGLLRREHEKGNNALTMALHRDSEPLGYGLVLTEPDGRITGFIEKPDWERVVTDRVNTGIYILSPETIQRIPEGKPFDFAIDLFPKLLREGLPMRGVTLPGYWCDVGTPEAYYRSNLDALHGRLRLLRPWGEEQPESAGENLCPEAAARPAVGQGREVTCADRAWLMRVLSEDTAAFGADFYNGMSLRGEKGGVHVFPCGDRNALRIEATGENAFAICESWVHYVGELEKRRKQNAALGLSGENTAD